MNSKKILVVDDDPDLRLSLNVRLKANDYEVIFAADGVSSIAETRKHMPNLIILDLGLPAGDGFTVLNWLKSNDSLSSIPVIVLSGRDRSTNRDRVLKAGLSVSSKSRRTRATCLRPYATPWAKGSALVYDLVH